MKVIYNNKEVANNTRNYNELLNKPLINSVELVGNTTLNDLNVYNKPQVDSLIASSRSVKVVTALPTPVIENTMYYVGPDANNLYHIYLIDSARNIIDLGMSQDNLYTAGNGIDIDSSNEISVKFDNATIMLDSEGLYAREATDGLTGVVKYDNDSIKKNSSGKLYVPTTKSGDRFGVYPYTDASGITHAGKIQYFYDTDAQTTNYNTKLESVVTAGTVGHAGDLWVTNPKDSTRSGLVLTHGMLDGTSLKYNTTSGKVYAVANHDTIKGTDTTLPVDEAAIQHLTRTLTVAGITVIPNNADLNTAPYTKPGRYRAETNASAASMSNCPAARAFVMEVENNLSDDESASGTSYGSRVRRFRTHDGTSFYVQSVNCSADGVLGFGPWKRVITNDVLKPDVVTSGSTNEYFNVTSLNDLIYELWRVRPGCVSIHNSSSQRALGCSKIKITTSG